MRKNSLLLLAILLPVQHHLHKKTEEPNRVIQIRISLNNYYHINLQLTSKEELQNSEVYFKKYLKEKLHLKIDDVAKKFNYIGKEYDADLVYFYLEIENIKEINTIEIQNKILTAHFPNQENLIKSKVGEKHKSILLNSKSDKGLLKF